MLTKPGVVTEGEIPIFLRSARASMLTTEGTMYEYGKLHKVIIDLIEDPNIDTHDPTFEQNEKILDDAYTSMVIHNALGDYKLHLRKE